MYISIHNIKSIAQIKTRQLKNGGNFVTEIIIETKDGMVSLTLFADTEEELKTTKSKEQRW